MISFQKISTYFFQTGRSDLRRCAPSSVAVFNHFSWRQMTYKPLLLSFFFSLLFFLLSSLFAPFFFFSPSLLSFVCFLQSIKFSSTLRRCQSIVAESLLTSWFLKLVWNDSNSITDRLRKATQKTKHLEKTPEIQTRPANSGLDQGWDGGPPNPPTGGENWPSETPQPPTFQTKTPRFSSHFYGSYLPFLSQNQHESTPVGENTTIAIK